MTAAFFEIPELVAMLARYLGPHDLAHCVQVSRFWHQLFLKPRWFSLDDNYLCQANTPTDNNNNNYNYNYNNSNHHSLERLPSHFPLYYRDDPVSVRILLEKRASYIGEVTLQTRRMLNVLMGMNMSNLQILRVYSRGLLESDLTWHWIALHPTYLHTLDLFVPGKDYSSRRSSRHSLPPLVELTRERFQILSELKSLKRLHVHLSDEDLLRLDDFAPALEVLVLPGDLEDGWVLSDFKTTLPGLRELWTDWNLSSEQVVELLDVFPGLEVLQMGHLGANDDDEDEDEDEEAIEAEQEFAQVWNADLGVWETDTTNPFTSQPTASSGGGDSDPKVKVDPVAAASPHLYLKSLSLRSTPLQRGSSTSILSLLPNLIEFECYDTEPTWAMGLGTFCPLLEHVSFDFKDSETITTTTATISTRTPSDSPSTTGSYPALSYLGPHMAKPINHLLESCTELKTLIGGNHAIHAQEMVQEKSDDCRPWICLGLQTLVCPIVGVPRIVGQEENEGDGSEIQENVDTGSDSIPVRPAASVTKRTSTTTSIDRQMCCQAVFEQLSQLTDLKVLDIGLCQDMAVEDREEIQAQSLDLNLEAGMGALAGLRQLKEFRCAGLVNGSLKDGRERAWLAEHWPEVRVREDI